MNGDRRVHCQHAGRCPGCPLIGLPYAEQLAQKTRRVEQALASYPALAEPEPEAFEPAEVLEGYRLRTKLVAERGKLGLFAEGSHEIVENRDCPVLRPALGRAVEALRGELHRVPELASLDLVEADGGVLVTLGGPEHARSELERFAREVVTELEGVRGVAVSVREKDAARVIGSGARVVAGPGESRQRFEPGAPYHYVSPGAFTQLHGGQAALLHRLLLAELEPRLPAGLARARVLELYGGSGALALRLAQRGARVTLVESFSPAARLAERAAREQDLSLSCLPGDAGETLRALGEDGARFDAVIVNPPRRGLDPEVRRLVGNLAPTVFAYVSCEPGTLARDADHLSRLGLRLARVRPLDMIPLSESVEVLAIFAPESAPAPRVLYRDDQLIAVEKPPHEPTTPQGEHQSSLLERVRRLDACEAAVPVHRLDLGTSGIVLFARRPEAVAELARALAEGEKEYIALARGITHKKGSVRRPLADGRKGTSARPALTRFERLRVLSGHSLLSVKPASGRTHQVRRHLSGLGHPVIGDERYGDPASNAYFDHRHGLDRTFLHLRRVIVERRGTPVTIECELAPDLRGVERSLSG